MPTNNEDFVKRLILKQNINQDRTATLCPYAWVLLDGGKLPVGPALLENLAELLECVDECEPKTYRVIARQGTDQPGQQDAR